MFFQLFLEFTESYALPNFDLWKYFFFLLNLLKISISFSIGAITAHISQHINNKKELEKHFLFD